MTTTCGELPTERDHPFDPPSDLRRMTASRPISRLAYPDGHLGWIVTSHELARETLSNPRFSSRADLQHVPVRGAGQSASTSTFASPGIFVYMDPPEHTKYRKLLNRHFTSVQAHQLKGRIEQVVGECLAAMRTHGSPVDLVSAFAIPVPSRVMCELLGVPYDERDRFQTNTATALSLAATPEESAEAFGQIAGYIAEMVERKRAAPGADLLSSLIGTGELTTEEIVNIGMLTLMAGFETTANMIGIGVFVLLCNPRQLTALRQDLSLMKVAVEELMRYATVPQYGPTRVALEDVQLGDQLVKAGETVMVSLPLANRDAAKFERPDEFDISRGASGQLAFGHGVHLCIGHRLARLEMEIAYMALLEEFPDLALAVPAEDVRMRSDMGIYGVWSLPVTFS